MNKRVVLDGKTSDWYEKAIFILKDEHLKRRDINFIQCAEGIIENYMKTSIVSPRESTTKSKESTMEKKQSMYQDACQEQRQDAYRWVDTFFVVSLCTLGIITLFYFI